MAKLCPACSKANPATASYCFYDGRHLSVNGREGPLQIGTMPLPMPFYFPDGQSCANFNQLALACDARWDEAKGLLTDGTWHSYFCTIGRLDLAAVAKQASREPDRDLGLSQMLEKIPTDPNTLRPPQLSLPTTEENLGRLTPGADRRFELMISNRGLLVLRGMATTNCDWLSLGDGTGASLKMFQTRGIYTLPVRVLGDRLRAGGKPLKGEIVIDTNGGAVTVPVRAEIPIRPFPGGKPVNAALAGAKSPRDIAVKAKADPLGAAILFEQGAVKAWYASNGWTYPVQGTQASGKGAVQQFFEALGLSKPPHLEIDVESLACNARVGRRFTKHVTISTKEARLVYAQGWSNQPWIKAGPGKCEGNKVTIPLTIEAPPQPGKTLQAAVTIQGNGLQRFVVPVNLTVAAARSTEDEEEEEKAVSLPKVWLYSVAIGLLLAIVIGVGLFIFTRRNTAATTTQTAGGPNPPATAPGPGSSPAVEAWWDHIPNTNFAASASALKDIAPQDEKIFDGIASKDELERSDAYEKLAPELPKLLSNSNARDSLGQLLMNCCVYEPSARCVNQLGKLLTSQIPPDGVEFQPAEKGADLARALWSLKVLFDAVTKEAIRPESVHTLALKLGGAVGPELEENSPPDKLKAQTEQLLALRYYRSVLPTAKKSLEHALTIRDLLVERFGQYLTPAFRASVDVDLLGQGLSAGNDLWPRVEPILKSCLEGNDPAIDKTIVELYEKADPATAQKMEASLATKWKVAGDAKTSRAEKVQAIQASLAAAAAAAKISPQERLAQLQKLTNDALSAVKADQKKETLLLRDAVRLAHASTEASNLFHKDAGLERVERFDELVKQIPDVDQTDPASAPEKVNPKAPVAKGKAVDGLVVKDVLTAKSDPDPSQPGSVCKVHLYALKANQSYNISVQSGTFNTHVRVEHPTGTSVGDADDHGILGLVVRLPYTPTEDGDYEIVVSTPAPGKVGKYQFQVEKGFGFGAGPGPFFGPRPFGPRFIPGMPVAQPQPVKTTEKKDRVLSLTDLNKLDGKNSTDRVAAFESIAGCVLNDLTLVQAQRIAKYLLVLDQPEDEVEKAKSKLASFGESRALLLALSDIISDESTPIAEKRTEAVIGGVLGQQLELAGDKQWRTACRTLLLQRALDLTSSALVGADQAADILCELYKEQGRAFGMEAPEFFELTRPTQALEGLIKYVAAKAAGQQNLAAADKEYLEQVGRYLQAAKTLADSDDNDLEHMVLLQRAWIRVLVIYLQDKAPSQVKAMVRIEQDLNEKDHRSTGVLDQLRAGEEKVLRVWALAQNLKGA